MSNHRPETLDEIVGQASIKSVCNIIVGAAKIKNEPIGHILFGGPSGFGKTTFAKALANEMGSKFTETNAVSLSSIAKLQAYIERIEKDDILFIDEIHGLSQKVCEWLYTVMEDFEYTNDKTGRRTQVPEFTVIGATTEAGDLPAPLKGRFQNIQEFTEYDEKDLILIVSKILINKGFKKPPKSACKYIAGVSRGIPRLAVNNAQWFYDYMLVNDIKELKVKDLRDIMAMKGVYEYGLTMQDLRYIEQLNEHGQLGLSSLSMKINVSQSTIQNDIEPYLQKLDLVEVDSRGRSLNFPIALKLNVI
jgi:Holliday junction DNA helicase RuvB